jgi:hypothetical protein
MYPRKYNLPGEKQQISIYFCNPLYSERKSQGLKGLWLERMKDNAPIPPVAMPPAAPAADQET